MVHTHSLPNIYLIHFSFFFSCSLASLLLATHICHISSHSCDNIPTGVLNFYQQNPVDVCQDRWEQYCGVFGILCIPPPPILSFDFTFFLYPYDCVVFFHYHSLLAGSTYWKMFISFISVFTARKLLYS